MLKPESDITQFSQELDAIISSNDALHTALQSDDPVLKTAARLTNNSHPTLSATARQNILAKVMDVAPTKPITPSNVVRGNFTAWIGRIAAMLIITIMVGLAAQPVSANSLPGDTLYPVKLGFETLELAFANSPSARAQTHLEHANERLREVQQLDQESGLIEETTHSAIISLNFVATIASDNAIFESNLNLIEKAETTLSNLEQVLSNNQISIELTTDAQLSLMSIRSLLPENPTDIVDLTPEVTEAIPDVTEEAIVVEVVPDVTEEAIVVEVIPDITEEAIVVEVIPNVTEDPQEIISLEEATYYIQSESRVNVRSGAGTNFDIVGVANQNTPVTVLSQNLAGDWLEIRLPNGLQGWVFSQLLDNTPGQSSNSGNASNNADANDDNNANGNANGNSGGNSNNNNNGNGNANGNLNGGGKGNANGNNGGNANGNSNGNANGNSNGS